MIDTIALLLNKDAFHISKPELFQPSAAWAFVPYATPYTTSKQNPSKPELRKRIYKPRLTLSNRINHRGNREIILKIELSLPKLLFGNNFQELHYKDFKTLVNKLVATLDSMGISTTAQSLATAQITAIHYGKNIALTDGSTPYHYINKIKEANIKLTLDVNQTDYRNEGLCYRWHCNSYEVLFYDKIRELEYSNKRSKQTIEKDNELQVALLPLLRKRGKKFEVLRMEVRLTKRAKMKQLFAKLGIKTDLTFKKLFKPAISKKILLHYLDELESRRPLLLNYKPRNDQELLAQLVLNNRDLGPKQIFQLFGLKKAMDMIDIRDIRIMFAHCQPRSWYRLMADLNEAKLPEDIQNPLARLRVEIERFKEVQMKTIT